MTILADDFIKQAIVIHAKQNRLTGLYVITDASVTDPEKLVRQIQQAIRGGARIVQYRNKTQAHEQRLDTCIKIRQLTDQANTLFIVNDDIELARQANADGVHLGQDDMDLVEARRQLGEDSLIGLSCYNQFELAEQAANQGADYVAFGSFFSSRTKPNAVQADIDLLKRAKRELTIPVVTIGGITTENGKSLIEAGADMLAVIDGIFGQPDIEATAREFCSLFDR